MIDPLNINIPLAEAPTPVRPDQPALPKRKLLQPSPDHPDDYILEIDNSSLEKFTTCPRSAENYLIHSREAARSSSATQFGKLFHTCVELSLIHGYNDATKAKQRELIAEHFLYNPCSPDDYRTADQMVAILDAYYKLYPAETFEVYHDENGHFVERPFKIELCTIPVEGRLPYSREQILAPWSPTQQWRPDISNVGTEEVYVRNLHVFWTGRIDLLLRQSDALWVLDHKTTSMGGETYYNDFVLSQQTVGYTWAAQHITGQSVNGLILNAVIARKPTKTGRAIEFDRRPYIYSPERCAGWEENTKHIVGDFVSNLARGYFPMHTKWCMGKYGTCPYWDNCALPAHQRLGDLSSEHYRDVTWSPIND